MAIRHLILACICCFHSIAVQSQVRSKPADPQVTETSNPLPVSKDRQAALEQGRGICEQLSRFDDKLIAALSIARVADLLWADDPEYGRYAFQRALDFSKPKSDASQRNIMLANYVRARVVTLISKHDSKWGKQLLADSKQREIAFNSAYEMLGENPDKAAEVAGQSISNGISRGMPSFLLQLRQKDASAADSLFLKTMAQLASEPAPDAQLLLLLGTYVFTSPRLQDVTGPGIEQTAVGGLLVPNITALRRNIPTELVRAYLANVAVILSTPVVDPAQKALRYAAARLLLPMAERFTPEYLSSFLSSMSELSSQVSPELTNDAAYQTLSPRPEKDLDETLKDIDRLSDEVRRNQRYLSVFADLWRESRFDRARIVASKITDSDAQAELMRLIEFGEAINDLEKDKQSATARSMADRMSPGLEKALLMFAISHARLETKDRQASADALLASMKIVQSLSGFRRAYLELGAASQWVTINRDQAVAILSEAIHDLNAQPAQSIASLDWAQTVNIGTLSRRFPLTAKGVNLDFVSLFSPFIDADLELSSQVAREIQSEDLRSQAFVAIAGALFQQKRVHP